MSQYQVGRWFQVLTLGIICLMTLAEGLARPAVAQEAVPGQAAEPLGQFVTVPAPVDDRVYAAVTSAALKLEAQAAKENRPALLVLQINRGESPLHQIQGLARFLTSAQLNRVKTIAWVPETLQGYTALLPLVCHEVVMHPDAEIGDLGRGKPLEPDDRQTVLALAQKFRNPRLSPAILESMLDRESVLWKARVRPGDRPDAAAEVRFLSEKELETLRQTKTVVEETQRIKDAGTVGLYRGGFLRSNEMIVSQTAGNRAEAAQIYNLNRSALRENPQENATTKARRILVEGSIDSMHVSFIKRQIDRCLIEGAELIVFEINSPGGTITSSMDLANMILDLEDRKVRTVAWIPSMAISGGAMAALACDEIYLTRAARYGDILPIEMRPGQPFERAPEKVLSPVRSMLQSLAKQKGRPEAVAAALADPGTKVYRVTNRDTGRTWFATEAEIDESAGLWQKGLLLEETTGSAVLTLNGERAIELHMADAVVASFDELRARLGIPAEARMSPVKVGWLDRMVFTLNTTPMKVLLLVAAIGFLYLELHFVTGLLGIASATCFSLFFWACYLGGTAGWLEVILFVLGVCCLLMEVFVIPGFGVFGISGILLVLASLVMALESFRHLDLYEATNKVGHGMATVGVAIAGVTIMGVILSRFLPHLPIFDQMVLAPPGGDGSSELTHPRVRPELLHPVASRVGRQGVAISLLRPAGKAQFGDELLDVVSEGPFLSAGTPVEILAEAGNRIVVRAYVPESDGVNA